MGCMADYSWELKYEEFEFSGKSMIKFKLLPDSFYERQWWYGEDFNKLVCNLKYDITGDSVVIELDMLSSPAAHNLLCDVLLISLYYVVTEDSCKQIGKEMISESLQLITSKGGNNINNKSFLISIHVEFILALLLDQNQMNALEEYKSSVLTKNRPVLTALKTTTIDCNNVKDFIDDSEACAICFEEYFTTVLGSKMIEMRCSFDLDMYENLGGRSSDDIILLPCSHKFHANCIAFWLKINNSCPICRFEMPSIATFAGVICLFYVGVDLSKSD